MKRLKKIIGSVLVMLMLCTMMTTVAYAEEEDFVWLRVANTSDAADVTVSINADDTVVSGLMQVTYDSEKLTYQNLTANDEYVAMYAVNADTDGVLVISWVGPEEYELETETVSLIQIHFAGVAKEDSVQLTGEAHGEMGEKLILTEMAEEIFVDITALADAVAEAEALKEEDYTEDSFTALESVLSEAKAVLSDTTATQQEVDSAEAELKAAMEALADLTELEAAIAEAEAKDLSDYTDGTADAYRDAIAHAKAVLADADATKEEIEAAIEKLEEEAADLVNGTGLRSALEVASYKEEYKYTEKSYKALKEAVDEAKAVMKDPDATQKEVNKATTKLQRAIDALKLLATYGGTQGTATGDNANIVLPAVMAVAAMVVIAVAVVMKKRGLAK